MTTKLNKAQKEVDSYISNFTQGLFDKLQEEGEREEELLTIFEFMKYELDLGIELTPQQAVCLKVLYGLPLSDQDIAILEYWVAIGRSTWKPEQENRKLQVLVLEAGRRCLVGNTLVNTEKGLVYLDEIEENLFVDTCGAPQQITRRFSFEAQETIQITSTLGAVIEGTPEHRLGTARGWLQLKDLKVGDVLIRRLGGAHLVPETENPMDLTPYLKDILEEQEEAAKEIEEKKSSKKKLDSARRTAATIKDLGLPLELTESVAYVLGVLTVKGAWYGLGDVRLTCYANGAESIESRIRDIIPGMKNKISVQKVREASRIISMYAPSLRFYFKALGLIEAGHDVECAFPKIARSFSPKYLTLFLRGIYDSYGGGWRASFVSYSYKISNEILQALLSLGIGARLQMITASVRGVENYFYKITFLEESDRHRFLKIVGTDLDCGIEVKDYSPREYLEDSVMGVLKKSAPVQVYDLEINNVHHYIANSVVSHNSGKSTIASIIGAYEFYSLCKRKNPQKDYGISTSTPLSILTLASSAEQSKKTIFGSITGILQNCKYFKSLQKSGLIYIGKEEVSYDQKKLYIYSGNSRASSQVGGTVKALILDEAACFTDAEGKSNAIDLWDHLGASCTTFGANAVRVAISSAMYTGDAIEVLYERTVNSQAALGVRVRSWDMNPIFASRDNPIIVDEYDQNPVTAALMYEGVRPEAVSAMMTAEKVDEAFVGKSVIQVITKEENNLIRAYILNIEPPANHMVISVCHLDPAISKDSYALAFGHLELNSDNNAVVVIDGLVVWEPSFSARVDIVNVGDIIQDINGARRLSLVSSDHFSSEETLQRLNMSNIKTQSMFFSNRQQVTMYNNVRSLLNTNRLILPSDSQWTPLLRRELCQVQIIKNSKIDHPSTGSKDLADAVVGVAWQLCTQYTKVLKRNLIANILETRREVPLNTTPLPPSRTGFKNEMMQMAKRNRRVFR